jgi:hypothetical protein
MSDVIKQAREILEKERTGEIAKKLGITPSCISPIKTGKATLTENMATRIVDAYNGKAPKPAMKKAAAKKPRAKKPAAKKEAKPKSSSDKNNQERSIPVDDYIGALEKHNALEELKKLAEEAVSAVIKETTIPALNDKLARFMNGIDERIEAVVQKALKEFGRPEVPEPPEETISELSIERISELKQEEGDVLGLLPDVDESAYTEESEPLEERAEIKPDPDIFSGGTTWDRGTSGLPEKKKRWWRRSKK